MERQARPQQLAPMSGSIPQGLRYGSGASDGIPATRHLSVFTAENASTFTPSNSVVRIPVSSGAFLDQKNARLCFDFTNKTVDDAVHLDGGAQCLIQRLRVLSVQGVELERIESYGLLHTTLDQYTSDDTHMKTANVLCGAPARCQESAYFTQATGGTNNNANVTAGGITVGATTNATVGGSGNALATLTLSVAGAGGIGYDQTQSDIINTGVTRHYEIPLQCGWFRPTSGKYLPPSCAYVLELTLGSGEASLVNLVNNTAHKPSYTLNNVELKIPAIAVQDPAFNQRIALMKRNGVSWRASTFKNHINTAVASASLEVLQLADRSMALRAIFSVLRRQAFVNDGSRFSQSRKSIQYATAFQYQIGSELYPPAQITIKAGSTATGGTIAGTRVYKSAGADLNISEAFAEAQRAFGTFGANAPSAGLVGAESFAQSEHNNGTGIIACDLSAYSDSQVISGIDTASQALPVALRLQKSTCANSGADDNAGVTAGQGAIQVDSYCLVDIEFMLMPDGSLTSRS